MNHNNNNNNNNIIILPSVLRSLRSLKLTKHYYFLPSVLRLRRSLKIYQAIQRWLRSSVCIVSHRQTVMQQNSIKFISIIICNCNQRICVKTSKNSLQKTFLLVAQGADSNPACSCSISRIWKTSPPVENISTLAARR